MSVAIKSLEGCLKSTSVPVNRGDGTAYAFPRRIKFAQFGFVVILEPDNSCTYSVVADCKDLCISDVLPWTSHGPAATS